MISLFALLIGIVAGLRAMTAPAAASWAARMGSASVGGTWLAFMGYAWTPLVLSLLAAAELVTDQLPSTPSRKVPVQFATRILMGALSGAVIGARGGSLGIGAVAGAIGAVLGTYGGAAARAKLAAKFGGKDRPAAIIEDVVAIGGAALIVVLLP
ncbi:DUF4126 domain-containing protein [Singulisphaera sp. Ch08]|uniref:DUF4126 domain-containing protein n=1 Tax=Singulisphaera sp. Ch08 TaxID=3120278 RepID=A0AAU7CSK2_9BACT